MVHGAYRLEVAEISRREIQPGSVCIGIGAHADYHAILITFLTGKTGSVVAFEPAPVNFEILRKNIDLNSFANVELESVGVNDMGDKFQFTLESE
jgi:FkbM family methyltransferase